MRYHGFFNFQEVWADNRDFYRSCVEDPDAARAIGVRADDAERNLELQERFSPEQPHNRLVAHQAEVYLIKDPRLVKKGKTMMVPVGSLERVLAVDFGQELMALLDGGPVFHEEIIEEDIIHELPGGTMIRGDRIRRVASEGDLLEAAKKYFNIRLDLPGDKWGAYGFEIDKKVITADTPFEYRITKYVSIDGEKISEEVEIARTTFKRKKSGNPVWDRIYVTSREPCLLYSRR